MSKHTEYNKQIYDSLALEFKGKLKLRKKNDKTIVRKFAGFLKERRKLTILDIGPGNGQMARFMTQKGFVVEAIEMSGKMAEVAKETAPKAKIIVGDFTSHNFKNKKYDGILAIAFIHLFAKRDVLSVLKKIHSILKPEGILYINTTRHRRSEEGFFAKNNFKNKLKRFRHRFTKSELWRLLDEADFEILHYDENTDKDEVKSKVWMNFVVRPN